MSANAAYIDNGKSFAPVIRTKIERTTAFILGGDSSRSFSTEDMDKDDYTTKILQFEDDDPSWSPQHDGLNVLFADSHVSFAREFDEDSMTYRYDRMGDWQN